MTRDELIEQNLGLVHLCAKKFVRRSKYHYDLYSTGSIGLIKAIDNFDESLGYKLSTYAVPVILGEIKRLFRDGGTVRVSRSIKELSLKITRYREKLALEGKEPTISELAVYFEVSEEQITEAISASQPALSLTGGDEEGNEYDLPVEPPQAKTTELIALGQCLGTLPPDDRRLIFLRYWKGFTQSETGKELGMTQVQVSRREKRILDGLREMLV